MREGRSAARKLLHQSMQPPARQCDSDSTSRRSTRISLFLVWFKSYFALMLSTNDGVFDIRVEIGHVSFGTVD